MVDSIKKISSGPRAVAAVLILLSISFFFRAAWINADPPPDLSISAASFADEGFKTYAARNKVLFGNVKWTPEDRYDGWVQKSPLSVYFYEGVFQNFGVSFKSIRVPSIIFTVLGILLFYIFMLRNYGSFPALVGLLVISLNYFSIMFSRVGFYENYLNFFIMAALLCLAEVKNSRVRPVRVLFLILAVSSVAITFFIKTSVPLIFASITPVLVLIFLQTLGISRIKSGKVFTVMVLSFFLLYVLFAHVGFFTNTLRTIFSMKILGRTLFSYLPLRSFDPLYLALGKSLYLEFIFLNPLCFFIALGYSVYVFHEYLKNISEVTMDLFISSWFLFGFLILTIMSYHPARYYLLIFIPMIILSVRALTGSAFEKAADFFIHSATGFYRLVILIIKAAAAIYPGVVFAVLFIPFYFRNEIKNILYRPLSEGHIFSVLHIIAAILCGELLFVMIIVAFRKKIYSFLQSRGAWKALISLILMFQLIQYGMWFAQREYRVYYLSKKIGESYPLNAIIAGSWSGNLVIENKLRSLILQEQLRYNGDLFKKMISGIPVKMQSAVNSKGIPTDEKNMPLYLVVCPDVIFEKKIMEEFKKYLVPEQLVFQEDLGYFHIEMYKIR